jgi:hypothetical protein
MTAALIPAADLRTAQEESGGSATIDRPDW